MGKPKLFVINLAGNNPVYFSGSNVEGNVSLELSEPKKTLGKSIVFSGKAYTFTGLSNVPLEPEITDVQKLFTILILKL